jgi:hypothetical protein
LCYYLARLSLDLNFFESFPVIVILSAAAAKIFRLARGRRGGDLPKIGAVITKHSCQSYRRAVRFFWFAFARLAARILDISP